MNRKKYNKKSPNVNYEVINFESIHAQGLY